MKILMAFVFSLAMSSMAMADAITSKDVMFYTADPGTWDGKKVTIMVTSCSSTPKLTADKKTTIFYVYSENGGIYVHMPSDKAKSFARRYANRNLPYARKILTGTFEADGPYIDVAE